MAPLTGIQPPDPRPVPTTVPPSLLIAILDLHPLSWSLLSSLSPSTTVSTASNQHPASGQPEEAALVGKVPVAPLTLNEMVTVLIVFLNAHLASGWGNEVVVYGAVAGKVVLLYPVPEEERPIPQPNFYAPFQALGSSFENRLKSFFDSQKEEHIGSSLNGSPALVSALTKALCHINRRHPPDTAATSSRAETTAAAMSTESRILVINATPGTASGAGSNSSGGAGTVAAANGEGGGGQSNYVGLMNCVFAAQKAKVPIDVLTLPPESTGTAAPIFLQQASYLTDGIYWRWNGRGGLLQYLHTMYLPPPSLRRTPLTCPPQDAVDFRVVCFCHQDVVDVGFVCSVCLSIFCKPLPACQMCKTRFPVKSHPTLAALAAHIQPIPVPDTVPSRPGVSGRKSISGAASASAAAAAAGSISSGAAAAPIVVE